MFCTKYVKYVKCHCYQINLLLKHSLYLFIRIILWEEVNEIIFMIGFTIIPPMFKRV